MSEGKDDMERRISGQTAEEAGYWDARLRSPECTDADRTHFDEWRHASSEHQKSFDQLELIVASLRQNMARADIRALRDAALRAERARTPHRRLFAAAAALVGAAVLTALWVALPQPVRDAPFQQLTTFIADLTRTPGATVYETGTGQRSVSTLRDGSSVELDAETRIKVTFTQSERKVELLYGQALFHVAHDEHRPFIVRAADREITAVGTQFDVRLDTTSVRVTLIEGKVKVSRETAAPSGESAAAARRDTEPRVAYLSPGQQLIARRADAESTRPNTPSADSTPGALIRDVDVNKVTGWRNGRIFLEDLPLTEAIAEMNRHSPVQINARDPQLAAFRVNGMFRAGEQETFVTALEQYFPVTARHQGDTEIVLTLRR
jgi:transmembrane sensor